jgi:uncharacterized protein YacL
MSNPSRIERHWDLVLTLVLVGALVILSNFDYLVIKSFSPRLAAAIFTVVIGASVSLLAIFASYQDMISNADDANLLGTLRKVFYWPIVLSIIGFILAILTSVFSLSEAARTSIPISTPLSSILSLVLAGLLIYAILSFREVFRAVYYISIYGNKDDDPPDEGHSG